MALNHPLARGQLPKKRSRPRRVISALGVGVFQRKDNDMSAIDKVRLFLACLAIANQEAHESPQDAGPVKVGIVGGEVMELGKQRGVTQIPF